MYFSFRDITINLISISRIHYEYFIRFGNSLWFTIYITNSLWIHYLFREFTLNTLSFSRIYYLFLESAWINYLYRELTMNSLSVSRIHYTSTVFFREVSFNSPSTSISYCEFTINPLLILQIHNEFTICFEILLFINNLFREFTICIANSLYINNHFRGFGLNQLSVSGIHFEFTIDFANSTSIFPLYSDSITYLTHLPDDGSYIANHIVIILHSMTHNSL